LWNATGVSLPEQLPDVSALPLAIAGGGRELSRVLKIEAGPDPSLGRVRLPSISDGSDQASLCAVTGQHISTPVVTFGALWYLDERISIRSSGFSGDMLRGEF
jgi:hypothetical protein